MNKKLFCHLLGRMALVMAVFLLVPFVSAWLNAEPGCKFLLLPPLAAGAVGFWAYRKGRRHKERVLNPEAAVYVVLSWLLLILAGMLPYAVTGTLPFDGAFLQAAADATGAGIIVFSPSAADSLFLWHAILGWLGGANFLLLLVTMIPLAGGWFGLLLSFRQGLNFSPMVRQMDEVGKEVLLVYTSLTVFAACLYWLAGMQGRVAPIMAMLTLSTAGGDVSHYLPSALTPVEKLAVAMVMLIACGNFWRYWRTFRRRDWRDYYRNRELCIFCRVIIYMSVIMLVHLILTGNYRFLPELLFYVLSYASTTGFIMPDTPLWPEGELFLLLLLALIGGTIGSPTGGLKILRFVTLIKLIGAEMKRTLHPHMLTGVVVDGESVPAETGGRILAFFFVYCSSIFLFSLMLTLNDTTLSQAVGIAIGTFTGLGAAGGVCDVTVMQNLAPGIKILTGLFMILGRTEIFACLLIPEYLLHHREKQW